MPVPTSVRGKGSVPQYPSTMSGIGDIWDRYCELQSVSPASWFLSCDHGSMYGAIMASSELIKYSPWNTISTRKMAGPHADAIGSDRRHYIRFAL